MKWILIVAAIGLSTLAGCAPVHVHEYLAQGTFSPKAPGREVGVRATTSADPADPNSFGAAYEPGATGFIIEFFGADITNDIRISDVRGTFTAFGRTNAVLSVAETGRDPRRHYYSIYAVPTGCLLATGQERIPEVLKYGRYDVTIHYLQQGQPHTATGTVKYVHKSHREIRVMGKGWN